MNQSHNVDQREIISILERVGKEACASYGPDFASLVASTTYEGVLQEAALYIVVPEITYDYRVISVEILNVAEIIVRFHTLSTNQSEPYEVNISEGYQQYELALITIVHGVLFMAALESLKNQLSLKREYKHGPIKNKIVPGQARVAVLINGEQINAGWIRVEGEQVVYYTGKGLREMWKPGMSAEEQQRAEELKKKTEQELVAEGFIERRKLSEFRDVL